MPYAIQIPRLGWSMEQGTFVGWLKKSGDNVQPGEPLFTLEGEKAIQEIEAVDAGTLHIDATNPAEGDIVAVGAVIGYLLAVGETAPPIPPRPTPAAPPPQNQSALRPKESRQQAFPSLPLSEGYSAEAFAPPASPAVRRLARQLGVQLNSFGSSGRISESDVCRRFLQNRGELSPNTGTTTGTTAADNVSSRLNILAPPPSKEVPRRHRGLPAISPRAARLAARHGVDWTQLAGSGSSGRIRECDVLPSARLHGIADSLMRTVPASIPAVPSHSVPITPMRRTIATRMAASLQQTAPVTLTAEMDVTSVVQFREELKRSGNSLIPSITDCFVKLVATALREHPLLNARWRDDALEFFDEVHVGIAVDTDAGLLVPVVRRADSRSLFEIAEQSRSLIEQVRSRTLAPSGYQGGTFTITNLGSLGIDAFTPIINFPETAILGLGRIQTRSAIALEDSTPQTVSSNPQVMTLSLTFDHRVLDGAPAARFLQTLARLAATDSPSLFEPPSHR